MAAVQALCPRTIYLDSGVVVGNGATDEVVSAYLDHRQTPIHGTKPVAIKIQDGLLLEELRFGPTVIRTGEPLHLELQLRAHGAGRISECAVLLNSARGTRVGIVDIRESGAVPVRYPEGRLAIKVSIDALPLVEGVYTVGLVLVTDGFSGELSQLRDFVVVPARISSDHAPYPAGSRGLVVLRASTSISLTQQVEIA
jgi:hypothetical protein